MAPRALQRNIFCVSPLEGILTWTLVTCPQTLGEAFWWWVQGFWKIVMVTSMFWLSSNTNCTVSGSVTLDNIKCLFCFLVCIIQGRNSYLGVPSCIKWAVCKCVCVYTEKAKVYDAWPLNGCCVLFTCSSSLFFDPFHRIQTECYFIWPLTLFFPMVWLASLMWI